MPKNTQSLKLDLEDLLVTKGYDVTMMDSSGKQVPTADNCDLFQFHFHKNGKDYGTVTVTVDGLQKLTVYYDDEIAQSGVNEDDSNRGMNGTSWISLVKQLKKFAHRHQLGFVLKDTDRLRIDMKRRVQQQKLEEGRVKELDGDLKSMTAEEFEKEYKMTKAEARKELKPKKQVSETQSLNQAVTEGESILSAGTRVVVVHKGKQVPGKIVRHDVGKNGYSNAYVVDVGGYESIFVPAEKIQVQGVAAVKSKKLDEGYYGNRKMSYSDDTPTVKMIIKHNRQLEETDQRFRHIEKIFLETSDGERFSVPTNKPSRARAFARHIAEGGGYKDDRWSHIQEICEDLDSLGGFVRATRGREQFNEGAGRMIAEATEQYQSLRESLKQIQSSRGYDRYFESYEPRIISEEVNDLSEAFMSQSLDERIERALPTLSKFGIKMSAMNETYEFESWADNIVDEALDPGSDRQLSALISLLDDELPIGPNAEVVLGELSDVIENDQLYDRLLRAANVNPNADARPHIISWMQEQDGQDYKNALEKINSEIGDDESAEEAPPQPAPKAAPEPKAQPEPKAAPEPKAQPEPKAAPEPEEEPAPKAELPPLSEDYAFESFKRLLSKKY